MKATKTTYTLVLPVGGGAAETFGGFPSLQEAKAAKETIRRNYSGKVLLIRSASGA